MRHKSPRSVTQDVCFHVFFKKGHVQADFVFDIFQRFFVWRAADAYVCTHIHICTYMYVIFIYARACMYTYAYSYMHVHGCIHTHFHICTYMRARGDPRSDACACMMGGVCVRAQTCARVHTCTNCPKGCVYIQIQIHPNTSKYKYMHTCYIHTCVYVHDTYMYMCVYIQMIHTCTCVCIYMIHTYMCVCIQMCITCYIHT